MLQSKALEPQLEKPEGTAQQSPREPELSSSPQVKCSRRKRKREKSEIKA